VNELPEGWGSAAIGELITSIDAGKNVRCVERPPLANEIGVVKVSAVSWGRFDPAASKTLPAEFKPSPHTRIRKGDFLFSRANTIELVGACVLVDSDPGNLYLSDKILRLNLSNENKLWLLWFLRSPVGRSALEAASSGNQYSMRNISQSNFLKIKTLVAPLAEQRRIVAKLDALSSGAERARAELDRISMLVERYKQAILDRAFTTVPRSCFLPIGKLASLVTSGSRGWKKYYSADGAKFIRVGNIRRTSVELALDDVQCVRPPTRIDLSTSTFASSA
jgi:type I restriction enzyme S subunit